MHFITTYGVFYYFCLYICTLTHMTAKEIGEQIRERRDILRLQQRDLAELAGISLRTIIQVENGSGNPSLATLQKLAKVLGLEMQLSIINK